VSWVKVGDELREEVEVEIGASREGGDGPESGNACRSAGVCRRRRHWLLRHKHIHIRGFRGSHAISASIQTRTTIRGGTAFYEQAHPQTPAVNDISPSPFDEPEATLDLISVIFFALPYLVCFVPGVTEAGRLADDTTLRAGA